MVRPPEMDPAVGSWNHVAMNMNARRRPDTRGHRLRHVHVAVMMGVVGRFAGAAQACGGSGGAHQQRNGQGSQQASQCRSKHRVCPFPRWGPIAAAVDA